MNLYLKLVVLSIAVVLCGCAATRTFNISANLDASPVFHLDNYDQIEIGYVKMDGNAWHVFKPKRNEIIEIVKRQLKAVLAESHNKFPKKSKVIGKKAYLSAVILTWESEKVGGSDISKVKADWDVNDKDITSLLGKTTEEDKEHIVVESRNAYTLRILITMSDGSSEISSNTYEAVDVTSSRLYLGTLSQYGINTTYDIDIAFKSDIESIINQFIFHTSNQRTTEQGDLLDIDRLMPELDIAKTVVINEETLSKFKNAINNAAKKDQAKAYYNTAMALMWSGQYVKAQEYMHVAESLGLEFAQYGLTVIDLFSKRYPKLQNETSLNFH